YFRDYIVSPYNVVYVSPSSISRSFGSVCKTVNQKMQSYTDKHVQPPDPRRQQVALQAKVTQKEVMQSKKVVLAKAQLSADRRRLPTSHMLDGSEVDFSEFNDSYEAP